jgi:hypothetical protein
MACRGTGEKSGQPSYLTVRVSGIVGSCNGCPEEDIAVGVIVMVEVPAGVTTGGGGATDALEPPQPAA